MRDFEFLHEVYILIFDDLENGEVSVSFECCPVQPTAKQVTLLRDEKSFNKKNSFNYCYLFITECVKRENSNKILPSFRFLAIEMHALIYFKSCLNPCVCTDEFLGYASKMQID